MDIILWSTISVTILLAGVTLAIKAYKKKDISLVGGVFTRAFFMIAIILYAFYNGDRLTLHLGVLLVALSDLILNIIYIMSGRYYKEIEHNKLVSSFTNLQTKYFTVIEHAPVGFFMLDQNFKFEFVNKATAQIAECSKKDIYTKTPFDFIVEGEHERLRFNLNRLISGKDTQPLTLISEYTIKTCTGKIKKIKVITDRTSNGHVTITGSILLLEG